MSLKKWVCTSIFLFIALNLSAYQVQEVPFSWQGLTNQFVVKNFTVEDGLPINSINYLLHHSDGFVYIATNDGLAKFDGYRFEIINTSTHQQLQSNRISWVGPGVNGELWLLDAEGNLYQFRDGELQWFQGLEAYKQFIVKKVAPYNDQAVIITTDHGLILQDGAFSFRRFSHTETLTGIRNSFTVAENTTYFLRDEGFYELTENRLTLLLAEENLLIPVDEVFNMILTQDEHIWLLGVHGNLLEIDPNLGQHAYSMPYKGNVEIWDFIELDEDNLLVSTSIGYVKFDRKSGRFIESDQKTESEEYFEDNAWNNVKHHTITKMGPHVFYDGNEVLNTSKSISYLTLDLEGNIWVATNGGGVFQLIPKRIFTIGNGAHPGFDNIYGMAEWDDAIWAAAFNHEMFKISETSITNWNTENSGIDYSFFRSVMAFKDTLYAGSFNLYEFTNGSWKRDFSWEIGSELIDALFVDSAYRFWIGTDSGFYLDKNGTKEPFLDRNQVGLVGVNSIQNYGEDALVIASEMQGVAVLTPQNEFRFITKSDGLSSNIIRDIYQASEDTLWAVTEDFGLNRIVLKKGTFMVRSIKKITVEDGLIDNSLHRLIDDGLGYFWINANKGMMRIPERALNQYVDGAREDLPVMEFGTLDGLDNIEGNGGTQNAGILTSNGRLLFPNQAGLVYTNPAWFVENAAKPIQGPVVEKVVYQDSEISVTGVNELSLPKGIRSVQIKFTLPEFSHPEKLELYYKMEGINQTWQPAGSDRIAVFTNLPNGINALEVKGRIRGEENFRERTFTLIAPPFFYETGWFLVVIGLGVVGLFFAGYKVLLVQASLREARLNNLVQERTQQLMMEKEKTDKALKKIQKLDEAKSRFFTNFTHELRTPLSLILSPLEDMLEDGNKPVKGNRDSLKMMRRNAVRLKELINQLLDVSKLNAGELALSFEPVHLLELTRQFSAQFEHSLAKKNIQFTLTGNTGIANLFVDINAWNHICTNLISNAIKFTPEGGSIHLHIIDGEKKVQVEFSDTGIGIPSEDLPFIFDSYYQGESSISKAMGTGIGLALVKGLVHRMGGEIQVSSRLDEGSKFTIYLQKGTQHISVGDVLHERQTLGFSSPVEEVEEVADEVEINQEPEQPLTSEKVLLVEDNEDFRVYLHSVIGKHYQIRVAKNGKEGLEQLESYEPDIIVSDIMMPEMDGYEMMNAIRNIDRYKNIPFVFLSAKDSAADIEKGLNIGADIYLSKPVENKLLLTQIKVLLRREQRIEQMKKVETVQEIPLVNEVQEIIRRHLGNPDLNVEMIAESLSMSSPTLYRKWRKLSKETINKTISRLRFEEALKLIEEESLTISEASYSVGFSHLSYFSNAFKKMYGVAPQEYIQHENA